MPGLVAIIAEVDRFGIVLILYIFPSRPAFQVVTFNAAKEVHFWHMYGYLGVVLRTIEWVGCASIDVAFGHAYLTFFLEKHAAAGFCKPICPGFYPHMILSS